MKKALQLYTKGSAFVSDEETLENGMYANFAILSDDSFTFPKKEIKNLKSILTVVGGKVVFALAEYKTMNPALPEAIPTWSSVKNLWRALKQLI